MIEHKTIEEFAKMYNLSCDVNYDNVDFLKKQIKKSGIPTTPILYSHDLNLITGIDLIQAIMELLDDSDFDTFSKEIPMIDVTDYLENIDIEYDNLKKYFQDTDIEKYIKHTDQW